jgi:lysophospholipase L1-like esterase
LVGPSSLLEFGQPYAYRNVSTATKKPGVNTMSKQAELNAMQPSRREFVQAGLGLGVAGLATFGAVERSLAADTNSAAKPSQPIIKPGDTILFQGDSITDAGRKRDVPDANSLAALGNGYAWLAAAQLLVDYPDANFKIFNRGISGNKVFQLAERWQADCLDLKPNVLSILIGVNDYWHAHQGEYNGTLETYESDYRALIQRTKDALPNVRLILCEPFSLKAGAVDDSWHPAFDGYRAAARRIADDAKAAFVPFQAMFDAAVKVAPPATWAADGVHPTPSGAALMAHWWLKAAVV